MPLFVSYVIDTLDPGIPEILPRISSSERPPTLTPSTYKIRDPTCRHGTTSCHHCFAPLVRMKRLHGQVNSHLFLGSTCSFLPTQITSIEEEAGVPGIRSKTTIAISRSRHSCSVSTIPIPTANAQTVMLRLLNYDAKSTAGNTHLVLTSASPILMQVPSIFERRLLGLAAWASAFQGRSSLWPVGLIACLREEWTCHPLWSVISGHLPTHFPSPPCQSTASLSNKRM